MQSEVLPNSVELKSLYFNIKYAILALADSDISQEKISPKFPKMMGKKMKD